MASAVADEALGNIRTVRAFAMEDTEIRHGFFFQFFFLFTYSFNYFFYHKLF